MSDRIGPWATALGALTVVAMVLIVVSIVHGALLGPLPSDLREVAGLAPGADVSRGLIALIALAGALPAVASLYVLWQARTLAALYGRGRVLTTDSADAGSASAVTGPCSDVNATEYPAWAASGPSHGAIAPLVPNG